MLLGEANEAGKFDIQLSLLDLARVLRVSIKLKPEAFVALAKNGEEPSSTLHMASSEQKAQIRALHALVKTGTVSSSRGEPLLGTLMLAWPKESPEYLAVIRRGGVRGANVMQFAAHQIDSWRQKFSLQNAKTKVWLLSFAEPTKRKIVDVCPRIALPVQRKEEESFISACGRFRIVSSALKSKSERIVSGEISIINNNVVLATDAWTYTNAVVSAEGDELNGEAKKAFWNIVFWNATRGMRRHPETQSLCDLTHCMVFLGDSARDDDLYDKNIIELLNDKAKKSGDAWFMFSRGGNERWKQSLPIEKLRRIFGENEVIDIKRVRDETAITKIVLAYSNSEEQVPCNVFMTKLDLRSCPTKIKFNYAQQEWVFYGMGDGHEEGFDLLKAMNNDDSGDTAIEFINGAF